MADFQSVKSHFDRQILSKYAFLKSVKSIMAKICHLPHITFAEDIFDGLMSLDFEVVSIKAMRATRRSPP
jgi:aspartyl/asparaginyl beta-hydroxylase (cupin superfamily)